MLTAFGYAKTERLSALEAAGLLACYLRTFQNSMMKEATDPDSLLQFSQLQDQDSTRNP